MPLAEIKFAKKITNMSANKITILHTQTSNSALVGM